MGTAETNIGTLQTNVGNLTTRVGTAESNITTLQSEMANVKPHATAIMPGTCSQTGAKLRWNTTSNSWECVAEGDPTVRDFAKNDLPTCAGGEVLRSNGVGFSCVVASTSATIIETDPKIGATTSNLFCRGTGSQVTCDQSVPALTEADPQVGAVTNGQWCRGDGAAIQCDQSSPGTLTPPICVGAGKALQWSGTNWVCNLPSTIEGCASIGNSFQGGRCVTTGSGALIAASADAPTLLPQGDAWPRNNTSRQDGASNTANLAAAIPGSAAAYCANLVSDGYDDWYLPAIYELNDLYAESPYIGGFTGDVESRYWSSTYGWYQWWRWNGGGAAASPGNGLSATGAPQFVGRVRCVRRASAISIVLTPSFANVTNQVVSTTVMSGSVTVSGFGAGLLPVTITGQGSPSFQINDGPWVTSGSISSGQTLRLRLTNSGLFGASHIATVKLGTLSVNWTATTGDVGVATPSFVNVTDSELNTTVMSNIQTITGFIGAIPVSISGEGSPQIQINGGAWVTSGSINPSIGQTLRLRLTTSGTLNATRTATVSLGTFLSFNWTATTEANAKCNAIGELRNGGRCVSTGVGSGLLIAATVEGSTAWGSNGLLRGATNVTNGAANTTTLASFGSGAHPAAAYCDALVHGSYSDWYLPARDELNQLFLNRTSIGGFASAVYQSSTEIGASAVWNQNFGTGAQSSTGSKTTGSRVRCVRRTN